MALGSDIRFRLKSLVSRGRQEAHLDDELQFHLEMEAERLEALGHGPEEARRLARLEFGAPESIKEQVRQSWGTWRLEHLIKDVTVGVRKLATRERRFAVVATASLALGLGAAGVIFSVVDAVLLQPLPLGQPDRVVSFAESTPQGRRFSTSDANLLDFAERSTTLTHLAAQVVFSDQPALGTGDDRVRLEGLRVTSSYFDVLGVGARMGRVFGPEDVHNVAAAASGDESTAVGREAAEGTHILPVPRLAVISDRLWKNQFQADEDIVGRVVDLDGEAWTILGVLAPELRIPRLTADIYLPHRINQLYPRADRRIDAFARLADGVTLEAARAELTNIARQLGEEYPVSNEGWGVQLRPIEEYLLGDTGRATNWVLLGAVAVLVLLAFVNVSNLILARSTDRLRELRVRLALGATRGRLHAQLATEALIIGLMGAGGALLVALWAVPVVRRLDLALPRIDQMTVDAGLALFLFLVASVATVAAALAPAFRLSRTSTQSLQMRATSNDRGTTRVRTLLVVSEIALAAILVLGAGLLLRSFDRLSSFETGFGSKDVLLAQIDLPSERYAENSEAVHEFFKELVAGVEALPGVERAGGVNISHFRGPRPTNNVADQSETELENFPQVQWRAATPGYFDTLGIPLLRGRGLGDLPKLEVVVSRSLASLLWPQDDAVGQQMRWNRPSGPVFEVVGVVGDASDVELGEAALPMVYLSQAIIRWPNMTVAVRGSIPAQFLAPQIRDLVAEIDPLLAAPRFASLDEQRREAMARPLLSMALLIAFAVVAVILASLGTYGLVAYSVSRREKELGLRMALGAQRHQIAGIVVGSGLRLVAIGLLIGLGLALALVSSLRALLHETSPFDPVVAAGACLVLLAVGVLSSLAPALRATRAETSESLREG